MVTPQKQREIWFVVGSQHLYGAEALRQVDANAREVVAGLNANGNFPYPIVLKPVATTPDEATAFCREANYDNACIGVITWMHTFSPAKMWIAGLKMLEKPMLQLHTQLGAEIPWATMDMDFMNLHQTAHGGREFAFMGARLRKPFSVAVGHWREERVRNRIDMWMRVCAGIDESRSLKVARFGDNMREVAVTEGDKVEAQMRFGYSTTAFGLGDLTAEVDAVETAAINALIEEYESQYELAEHIRQGGAKRHSLLDAARIEIGLRRFLTKGGFKAFTTNFENLSGLKQLPGLAVQRLMAEGYGFGAEGDWKTAALLRTVKAMTEGLPQGTSFMEDYTYHMSAGNDLVLGAHMLEVCPSIAQESKPFLDVKPLGIGGKEDPARLIFNGTPGPAVNAAIMDMGNRFRLLVNEVQVIDPPHPLPKLPVARAVWTCQPSFEVAVEGWIIAGGAHHTVLSQAITSDYLRMFADELGIECLVIGQGTDIPSLKNEIRWNDLCHRTGSF